MVKVLKKGTVIGLKSPGLTCKKLKGVQYELYLTHRRGWLCCHVLAEEVSFILCHDDTVEFLPSRLIRGGRTMPFRSACFATMDHMHCWVE